MEKPQAKKFYQRPEFAAIQEAYGKPAHEVVVQLSNEGLGLSEISRRFGVSNRVIINLCESRGIACPRRSRPSTYDFRPSAKCIAAARIKAQKLVRWGDRELPVREWAKLMDITPNQMHYRLRAWSLEQVFAGVSLYE